MTRPPTGDVDSMREPHTTHIQERLPNGRVVVARGWSLPQRGCGKRRPDPELDERLEPL